MTTEPAARGFKGRSPSYPGISLPTAVDRARKLYEQEGRNKAPLAAITAHWGYKSPTSGPASVTYAALRKFGLLQDEGTGSERLGRLTDLALDIIMSPDPVPLLQDAALRPPIHREMWDRYGMDLPSDQTLRWELVRQRGFTDSGFKEFIREYRETVAFADLAGAGTLTSETPPADEDGGGSDGGHDGDHGAPRAAESRRGGMKGKLLTIPVPVAGGPPVMIEGEFPISEAAWNQLLAVLAAMKPGLVAQPEDQPNQSTEPER